MNRHFEDTKYYVKRAGKTAKQGVSEELGPIQERLQAFTSGEEEPEPTRVEQVREDLATLGERAEGEAKEALETAREKLGRVREEPAN